MVMWKKKRKTTATKMTVMLAAPMLVMLLLSLLDSGGSSSSSSSSSKNSSDISISSSSESSSGSGSSSSSSTRRALLMEGEKGSSIIAGYEAKSSLVIDKVRTTRHSIYLSSVCLCSSPWLLMRDTYMDFVWFQFIVTHWFRFSWNEEVFSIRYERRIR